MRINAGRFPPGVRFGNIVTGLPIPAGSAKAVYASHVLEHLSLEDFELALKNTLRILAPGGVFRLVVPDLDVRLAWYREHKAASDPLAAPTFVKLTGMGRVTRPHGLLGYLRGALGASDHLWMWDNLSMIKALSDAGFTDVRVCKFGDAEDPDFALVEEKDRFYFDEPLDRRELACEARCPM